MRAHIWIRIAISLAFLILAVIRASAGSYTAYVVGGVFYGDENLRDVITLTHPDYGGAGRNFPWQLREGATVRYSGTYTAWAGTTSGTMFGPQTVPPGAAPSRTLNMWIQVDGVWTQYGSITQTYTVIAENRDDPDSNVETAMNIDSPLSVTYAVTVTFNYISWCADPQPLKLFASDQESSFTPDSGTREDPSENSATHTFNLTAAQMANNRCGVKTSTGIEIWATGFYKGPPLISTQTISSSTKTIACDEPPEPPTTETKTDTGTGTETTTTSGPTAPEVFGPPAPGGTTTTTTTTTQQPPSVPGGELPPSKTYTDTNTKFEGAGNPSTADMTKQDFYEGTKQALKDAGNSTGVPPPGAKEVTDYVQDEKGKSEDVEAAMQAAFDGIEDTKTGFMDKLAGLDLDALPTSIGTVPSINFGTLNFGSASGSLDVNLSSGAMGTALNLIRTVFLFGLTIGWIVLCVSTVREYL